MDKATLTMMENLHRNTGRTLEQWMEIVKKENFAKHGEAMKFLKETHGLTHGFANLIALKAKGSDSGSAENPDDLIAGQYKGKEHFRPLYDRLMSEILSFGSDIDVAPKNAYVSLRRKKQFATLQPASKTRFEIGIILKGQPPQGKLEVEKPGMMCSHKICIAGDGDLDAEVMGWLKAAYDNAG